MRKKQLRRGIRKAAAAAVCLTLVCGVCACGGGEPDEPAENGQETRQEADETSADGAGAAGNAGEEAAEAQPDEAAGQTDTAQADVPQRSADGLLDQVADEEVPQLDGYTLLWHDEFNGTQMNEEIWNYEPHAPGWTNAELQEYTESADNVFVWDGKMVIKAIKTQDEKGKDYYTSGKVTTKGKQDFLYGKVTARAKVPEGKGLWPAFWMMPTSQSLYGNWPRCGEIDIMEILGDDVQTAYGTIHYGKPHAEQQGKFVLSGESFADDFHEFSVEWEPGEMRFYVDDQLYHTVNDWFSGDVGIDDRPYPAPFDQNFYVQLNLAVGGTWPGNPDETTDFDRAEFAIDYVRVYQKEHYDTNVTKPEKVYREATEDGNYIYNGDFAEAEDLADEENWVFLLDQGGAAQASIQDGMIAIDTEKAGTVDYAVQLVQADLPMIKGDSYRLIFEACAEEAGKMNVCVSAPTAGWGRYLPDTAVELAPDWQTYTYDFKMKDRDDNNGRLEFNLGGAEAAGAVRIRGVRLEKIEAE